MEEINAFPVGSTFPDGNDFPVPEVNFWKEEWKTRTPDEIQRYFFPEAVLIQKNNVIVNDTTGVFEYADFDGKSDEPCPCEKDRDGNCPCEEPSVVLDEVIVEDFIHSRKVLGFDDITIWFFTSSDGAKLLRAHRNLSESKSKSPDVLAVFMETSDNFNTFGSVMDFVVGDNVKRVFSEDRHWSNVLEFLERNEITVSAEDTKELFNKALRKENILTFFARLFKKLIGKISNAVFTVLADNFSLIAKGIQGFKYDDKDWDTSDAEFSAENAPFIFVRHQNLNAKTLEKTRLKSVYEIKTKFNDFRKEIDSYTNKLPGNIKEPLDRFLAHIEKKINRFFELFHANYSKFLTVLDLGNDILNAFLCGFIDGFFDIVAFVFVLFELLFDAIKGLADYNLNMGYYGNLVIEYIENGIEALSKFDVLDFAQKIISLPLENLAKFVTFIKNLSLPNINFSKVGYFSGYIIFGIVQIILELYLTGGTATVERFFSKAAQLLKGVLKKSAGLAEDVFAALGYLIKQIGKGADHFAAYVRTIFDDIFKWLEDLFRSGKADDVFEDIQIGIRKAVRQDIEELARIRKFFGAGKKKNVAFTKGEIGGKKIELWSRSGGEKGQKFDNFKAVAAEDYQYIGPISDYIHHTEQKQIEYLYKRFKHNKGISGKIEIVSDKIICENCDWIISAFQKDFPNIKVTRVWVREVLD